MRVCIHDRNEFSICVDRYSTIRKDVETDVDHVDILFRGIDQIAARVVMNLNIPFDLSRNF